MVGSLSNTSANTSSNKQDVVHLRQVFTRTKRLDPTRPKLLCRGVLVPPLFEVPDVQLVSGPYLHVSGNQMTPIVKHPVYKLDSSRINTVNEHCPCRAVARHDNHSLSTLTPNYAEAMVSTSRHASILNASRLRFRRSPSGCLYRDPRPATPHQAVLDTIQALACMRFCPAKPSARLGEVETN